MNVKELKEAIRLAEAAGDHLTAEKLKKKLQQMKINE